MVKKLKQPPIKRVLAATLMFLGLYAAYDSGEWFRLLQLFVAPAVTIALDLPLYRYWRGRKRGPESALITGLLVALVLTPLEPHRLYVVVAGAAFAILSKHLLRPFRQHVFNPAAFGIFLACLLFEVNPVWWGYTLWPVVVVAGIYVAFRVEALEMTALFIIGSGLTIGWGIINPFFALFMLTEHKTAPKPGLPRLGYAVLATLFCWGVLEFQPLLGPFVTALLLANLSTMALRKMPRGPVWLRY